jgi:hypothetical protein
MSEPLLDIAAAKADRYAKLSGGYNAWVKSTAWRKYDEKERHYEEVVGNVFGRVLTITEKDMLTAIETALASETESHRKEATR